MKTIKIFAIIGSIGFVVGLIMLLIYLSTDPYLSSLSKAMRLSIISFIISSGSFAIAYLLKKPEK